MLSIEIRKAFKEFWSDPKKEHSQIENVSLVPVNDPTILFTNCGMFPLVPYLLGEKHPKGTRLYNFQRSLRTAYDEIEEIGDNRHTLMFEMIGNWSLGDYFKKEQIPWIFELYTKYFQLEPSKIYVSVFAGNEDAPRDFETINLWQAAFLTQGINAVVGTDTLLGKKKTGPGEPIEFNSNIRIFPYNKDANWWRRGETIGELGGPDSEIFFDTGSIHDPSFGKYCHINCDCGRFIEIGNNVFMQYKLDQNLKWQELTQKNIDFGGGFERIVMISQNKTDIFLTDLFTPIIHKIEELSGKLYISDNTNANTRSFRVIADHIRGSVFILGDGIAPSNKDQGYILRSLIRRMIRKAKLLNIDKNFTVSLAQTVIGNFQITYPQLKENETFIITELEKEEVKFERTINNGLKELQRIISKGEKITGEIGFKLYETYGFPIEMILEEIKDLLSEIEKKQLLSAFENEKQNHRQLSQTGAEKKFKGGLADHSAETTALHTTHHLLLAALQEVLGKDVKQKGSNITAERLRLDFSHEQKLSAEQLEKVTSIVNQKIVANLIVEKRILPKKEAEKIGAEMEFGQKYGEMVNVYLIHDTNGKIFSAEFCGGPHVSHTGELKKFGHFNILKQENLGSGIKRIKAGLVKIK
ncbi:MAG: alanine--tRNA ligase-related protein [bacterium]